jgi:hypothetical protein
MTDWEKYQKPKNGCIEMNGSCIEILLKFTLKHNQDALVR